MTKLLLYEYFHRLLVSSVDSVLPLISDTHTTRSKSHTKRQCFGSKALVDAPAAVRGENQTSLLPVRA